MPERAGLVNLSGENVSILCCKTLPWSGGAYPDEDVPDEGAAFRNTRRHEIGFRLMSAQRTFNTPQKLVQAKKLPIGDEMSMIISSSSALSCFSAHIHTGKAEGFLFFV